MKSCQKVNFQSLLRVLCLVLPVIMWSFLMPERPLAAEDALEFIVRNNPELRELSRYNEYAFSRLRIKARASVGSGAGSIGQEGLFTQGTYDARIIAEMPLFSPRERLDMRMKEFGFRRQLRSEASAALARYRKLRRWIGRESIILKDLEAELSWLKRRAEAGIEPQKVIMEKALDLKEREQAFYSRKEEMKHTLQAVLSFVPREKRKKLSKLLRD